MNAESEVKALWDEPWCHGKKGRWHVQLFGFGSGMILLAQSERTRKEAWQAALDFTRKRQEEIRQIEEEIEWMHLVFSIAHQGAWSEEWQKALKRSYRRLTAQRDELKKGLRD